MSRARKLFNVGYALVLAVVVASGVVTYINLGTIDASNRGVENTREVLIELRRLQSSYENAETNQRAYIQTGEDAYRKPFRVASAALDGSVDRLASLSSDDPAQRGRIAELVRLKSAIMEIMHRSVALREKGDSQAARAAVRSDDGKRAVNRAGQLVAEMVGEEERLLQRRTERSGIAHRRTVASFTVATATAVLLLAAIFYLKRHEDIEQERAAEAVRKSEAWLATTLESIGDAVIATDGRGRVRFINPVGRTLSGWSQEATGRALEEVFRILNETTRQPVENPVARVLREGVVVNLAKHTILVARDGTETPIDDSAAPIRDERGDVAGVVLVFRDASAQRRHEESLRLARDAAEDANRAKDQFLAVLSHELRTPLNPVLLATTAMLDDPPSPEDVRPALEMIKRNVELEARLIDDLLDVTRIIRGKMPLQWGVADCHDLIRRAVEICRGDIGAKNLRLAVDLPAAHHHAHADPARLQQVLWNLVQNAVKFTPPGGSIAIRSLDEGGRLTIEIEDTGVGIEPEILAHIFDPFRQGETSILRRFGGLGLGLAICRGIVEAHGGRLVAESRGMGQGATFRVELGVIPRPEAGNGVASGGRASERSQPLKVLVVEDEPQTLRLLARLMRGLGHEVTTAETLSDACRAAKDGDHDLIISDIGLPDGCGLDLMRQVVERRGKLPAIALTGYGTEEDVQRSKAAGFAEHMTKPIDFTQLKAVISQITA